ncbi:ATP-binding protein [Streptomyces sp. NPDC001822]|uniref:ATP-binding protein n=1 Tax=Streptomyces sp. NPDC001822 TaxID=3364614 RepID=UPI003691E4DF
MSWLAELNEMGEQWDRQDDPGRIGSRSRTIAEEFALEQPLLLPLPEEPVETGRLFTPRVDRYGQIPVRTNRYSVSVRLIGKRVRVILHASHLVVYDQNVEVAHPNIDPATIHTLASCEWIKKSQPLCRIGDSGTGNSHMLIALGTEAAMKGYRVRYTLATNLVNELAEAADEKQLNKTIARYGRVDLLCIDELGCVELDRHGAELLFQVLTEREEKNSVAIASNESFGGWTKTFTDPRLCAAIVDRLTFYGTIIETGTDSYRLASPHGGTGGRRSGAVDRVRPRLECLRRVLPRSR